LVSDGLPAIWIKFNHDDIPIFGDANIDRLFYQGSERQNICQAAGSGHLSKEFNDAPFSAANSK
jgi:hypothetical protein